jgi:hypothetical protein
LHGKKNKENNHVSLTESKLLTSLNLAKDDSIDLNFVSNVYNPSTSLASPHSLANSLSRTKRQDFKIVRCGKNELDESPHQNYRMAGINREVHSPNNQVHFTTGSRDKSAAVFPFFVDNSSINFDCKYNIISSSTDPSQHTMQMNRQRVRWNIPETYPKGNDKVRNQLKIYLQYRETEIKPETLSEAGQVQSQRVESNCYSKLPKDPCFVLDGGNDGRVNESMTATVCKKALMTVDDFMEDNQRMKLEIEKNLHKKQTQNKVALLVDLTSNLESMSGERARKSDIKSMISHNYVKGETCMKDFDLERCKDMTISNEVHKVLATGESTLKIHRKLMYLLK